MSGGALTDYHYDIYKLDDWADALDNENRLLADNMRDLSKVLTAYDMYLSGDWGEDRVEEEWEKYRSKWFHISNEDLQRFVSRLMDENVFAICHGHSENKE